MQPYFKSKKLLLSPVMGKDDSHLDRIRKTINLRGFLH